MILNNNAKYNQKEIIDLFGQPLNNDYCPISKNNVVFFFIPYLNLKNIEFNTNRKKTYEWVNK